MIMKKPLVWMLVLTLAGLAFAIMDSVTIDAVKLGATRVPLGVILIRWGVIGLIVVTFTWAFSESDPSRRP